MATTYKAPTNEELISLLIQKINDQNQSLPPFIREAEVYSNPPEQLTRRFWAEAKKKKEWYFFTKNTSRGSKRVSRSVGPGTWRGTQKVKKIHDCNGRLLGFKHSFEYRLFQKAKAKAKAKTPWRMEEFSVVGYDEEGKQKTHLWVICRIYFSSLVPRKRSNDTIAGNATKTTEVVEVKEESKTSNQNLLAIEDQTMDDCDSRLVDDHQQARSEGHSTIDDQDDMLMFLKEAINDLDTSNWSDLSTDFNTAYYFDPSFVHIQSPIMDNQQKWSRIIDNQETGIGSKSTVTDQQTGTGNKSTVADQRTQEDEELWRFMENLPPIIDLPNLGPY